MGADLYIEDYDHENDLNAFEVSKRAVHTGYFRDPYNDGSLFNFIKSNIQVDLSWWHFADHAEWFDEERNMTVSGAEEFKSLFENLRSDLLTLDNYIIKYIDYNSGDYTNKKTKHLSKEDTEYYMNWLDLLIEFLGLAIKKNKKIRWSV